MPIPAHDSTVSLSACAYATVWRIAGGILVAVSRVSLPLIAIGVLTTDGPVPLIVLLRALAIGALLPAIAAWLIERACMVDVEVGATELVLHGRGMRVEIPRTAMLDIRPWMVPLPGPGVALRLRSGRRFSYGLQAADPTRLLAALADRGIVAAGESTRHPILVYAHAHSSVAAWRWYHLVAKFVLFALVPTAVWFNAHQHIAYGGLLGQYYLEGLGPYLQTFRISWSLAAIYLLLYASVWRAAAEGIALLVAWVAPTQSLRARRAVEIACRVVYYAGVPLLVLLPFLR